jgi:hypothetical protein
VYFENFFSHVRSTFPMMIGAYGVSNHDLLFSKAAEHGTNDDLSKVEVRFIVVTHHEEIQCE